MANRIVLKKGTQPGAAPTASDLLPGELAINTADGGLFTRLDDGSVYTLVPRSTGAITNQTISASLVTAGTFPNGTFQMQNLTVTGTLNANASTATKLSSERTLQLTGDVTGSVSSDLQSGFSIATTLGTVAISKGGTGLTTAPAALQLLVGQSNGSYALRTLTAGENIVLTEANGAITIDSSGGGASVTVSATAPADPEQGDLWYDSDDGSLKVYYVGSSSSAWVDATAGFVETQGLFEAALTTSATTANQVFHSFIAANYRAVKYVVQVSSGSAYQASEILVVHDGTTAYSTEYAVVQTGSTLVTFSVDMNAGNVRLLVTPTNAITTIKARGTTIDV